MPELPEVETVRRGLADALEGDVIERATARRRDLRFPFPPRFARRLAGRTIRSVDRRAKYLLVRLDDGEVLIVHLGMSGSFRITQPSNGSRSDEIGLGTDYQGASKLERHDHVVLDMRSGRRAIYNDPRRFGFMDLVEADDLEESRHLARVGIEPLGNAFGAESLAQLYGGRRTSLKAALLDQRLVAGIGNIYACEAMWRARLAPGQPAAAMATKTGRPSAAARRLADAIRDVLNDAIAAGGSSISDHIDTAGAAGAFQDAFAVYDREGEPCQRSRCRGTIDRIVQSGRSTFFCPVCQRARGHNKLR